MPYDYAERQRDFRPDKRTGRALIVNKPKIITTVKPLPFDALSPSDFERMYLWLVEREGFLRPQHLGETGSEQGRDIVAYRASNGGRRTLVFSM